MKKEIVVYWSNEVSILSPEIVPAHQDLFNIVRRMEGIPGVSTNIKKCPSVINTLKNTFAVRSAIDFNIEWTGQEFSSDNIDVKNERIFNPRDVVTGLVSVVTPTNIICFTEEPSLKMEVKNATYAKNDFSNKAVLVEGEVDIGKWFRPTDLSFFFRQPSSKIDVRMGDNLFYIKFNTDKKVILKKYQTTNELYRIQQEIFTFRQDLIRFYKGYNLKDKLENYYAAFKNSRYKKHILKEIKNNLME
jgi:hypothetical protein